MKLGGIGDERSQIEVFCSNVNPLFEQKNSDVHINLEKENLALFEKIGRLKACKAALGGQNIEDCHHHVHSSPDKESETENLWKKRSIQWGQFGEASAGSNAFFIIPPLMDAFLQIVKPNIASTSFMLDPSYTRLNMSLTAILISAYGIWRMMTSAAHCHALQEKYNVKREELLNVIENVIYEAQHNNDLTQQRFQINSKQSVTLDQLMVISPADTPKLDFSQRRILLEDVGAHMIEFTGLVLFAVTEFITNDPRIALPVGCFILMCSYFACRSEQITCANTMKRMNALVQGKIIEDTEANSEANAWTMLSASTKLPALLVANFFEFQKLFLGSLPAALALTFLTSFSDTICQFILSKVTQSEGESQAQQIQDKSISKWNHLSWVGRGLIAGRIIATGSERSAAYVIALSAALRLSSVNQSITTGVLWIVMSSTTHSLIHYNDMPNFLRQDQPLLCGHLHTIKNVNSTDEKRKPLLPLVSPVSN